jgi:hypothetical protein
MFLSEKHLSQEFYDAIAGGNAPFNPRFLAHEFDYREGRADVVGSDHHGDLFAFEMKLRKWRDALNQAYRNTSFAHFSYVVLPYKAAQKAVRWRQEFVRRGVGLCSVSNEGVKVEIDAKRLIPLRPWLTQSAINYVEGKGHDPLEKILDCSRRHLYSLGMRETVLSRRRPIQRSLPDESQARGNGCSKDFRSGEMQSVPS